MEQEDDDQSDLIMAQLNNMALHDPRWFMSQNSEPSHETPVLSTSNMAGVAKYIMDGKAKNIIVLAGAGISTGAGIPDFRSAGGIYDKVKEKFDLEDPTLVFEIEFFRKSPQPFYDTFKELLMECKPIVSHYFVKLLEEKSILKRIYTQNIDGLELRAGCGIEFDREKAVDTAKKGEVPLCNECNSPVKPDIVFFGEDLPSRFDKCWEQDFKECDLLIIMGSSLSVAPVCGLAYRVGENVPRIVLNKTDILDEFATPRDYKRNRNAQVLGDVSESCEKFASHLGWTEELEKLASHNN